MLMHVTSLVWACKHIVLKCLYMDSGLRRRYNSGFPRGMHKASMFQAKAGFRHSQMPASNLSSVNMAFWVGPLLPFARIPLLILSDVVLTRR